MSDAREGFGEFAIGLGSSRSRRRHGHGDGDCALKSRWRREISDGGERSLSRRDDSDSGAMKIFGFRDSFVGAIAVLFLAGDAPSTERRVLVGAWASTNIGSKHCLYITTSSSPSAVPSRPAKYCLKWRSVCSNKSTRTQRRTLMMQSSSNIQPTWWSKCLISELPYDSALRALEAYHRNHGDLAISVRFIVPATNEYPVEWHGVKIARHVYNMKWWQKHIAQNSDRVSQLNRLGFVWARLQPQWNLFMESMIAYRNIYGHVLVPASFVVPRHDDHWPRACWDLPIGSIVQRLRLRHDFLTGENAIDRRKQLDGLGFVWDVSEYNFLRFFMALKHFERLSRENYSSSRDNTSIRVPSTFVVPPGEENGWPPDLWEYPLGAKTMAVRQKQLYVKSHPDRKQALEDIGFRWKNGNASLGWLDVVHAAAIYSQMHGRILNVPLSFTVPAPPQGVVDSNPDCIDSWPWPERLWGLKLGQRLKDIRLKSAYLKGPEAQVRRAQLDNLGFVWNPKRGRIKRF